MHRAAVVVIALLAAVAPLTPAALAQRPDDRAGMIGVGSVTVPAQVVPASATRPDDRADARGPGIFAAGPTTILIASDGFDWSDAGIGLAGGLGLALVAVGLLARVTHRHRAHRLA